MHLLFSQLALGCMYILALCCWLGCAHARWDTIGDTLSKAGDVLGPIGDALGIVSFLMDDEIWEADTVGGTQVAIGVNREGDKQDDFVRHTDDLLSSHADWVLVRENKNNMGI